MENQIESIAVSSLWEIFFHYDDSKEYNRIRSGFINIISENLGVPREHLSSVLPPYAELYNKFILSD
jgi:hypothetical protein